MIHYLKQNRRNKSIVKFGNRLLEYIEITYEYISILINIPKNAIKSMLDSFVNEIKNFEKRK